MANLRPPISTFPDFSHASRASSAMANLTYPNPRCVVEPFSRATQHSLIGPKCSPNVASSASSSQSYGKFRTNTMTFSRGGLAASSRRVAIAVRSARSFRRRRARAVGARDSGRRAARARGGRTKTVTRARAPRVGARSGASAVRCASECRGRTARRIAMSAAAVPARTRAIRLYRCDGARARSIARARGLDRARRATRRRAATRVERVT